MSHVLVASPPQRVSSSEEASLCPAASATASPSAHLWIDFNKLLGEGTSGKAYQVVNEHDKRDYCVKVMRMDGQDKEARAVVANEAELHASLTHANIVRYCFSWAAPSPEGDPWFHVLMELCRTDLWSCVEAALVGDGASALERSKRRLWSRQIASALAHMHAHCILHRDLNPWNVFVTASNDAKIGDFGLSVRMPPSGVLSGWETPGAAPLDASAIGSLYSAPELGSEAYGYGADSFSLGMILLLVWTCAASVDDAVSEMEALRNDGVAPSGWVDASSCPYAPLVFRLAAHDGGSRPTAAEAIEEIDASERMSV